jgi:protoporphyrinogen oxidase
MIKIGIIGAGFGGLSTAYYLSKIPNCKITIFEKDDKVGGLSKGFKMPEWKWNIDDLIHHWFANDKYIFEMIKDLNLEKNILLKKTKSSMYYKGKIAELDSPTSLLKLPFLSFFNRIRVGIVMALLRFDKNYLKYETKTSYDFLKKMMGEKAFNILWLPLFEGKFGNYAEKINASWFWARINPRTKKLAYYKGGFQKLLDEIATCLKKRNVKLRFNSLVTETKKIDEKIILKSKNKDYKFDYVINTAPLPIFLKITKELPKDYKNNMEKLKIISSQYFVIELNKKFLVDGSYWLNINDKSFPFMMIAEHTNFVDNLNYNKKSIIWVGKYLDNKNKLWRLNKKQLLKKIIPCLKKINPNFKEADINRVFFKRYKYAQPIIELNYSKKKPPLLTPIKNLYIANMHQIYPEDRGTNNAVALGKKVAQIIKNQIS